MVQSKYLTFINKLFPLNSKRRLFVKIILVFIRHPFRYITKITPKHIIKLFSVLKKEGTAGVTGLINKNLTNIKIPKYSQTIDVAAINYEFNKIEDYKTLIFKKEENPEVSVIIPAYNQFNYSYNCLMSILKHTGDEISYEIIFADDCSDDLTVEINKAVFNINVVRTHENLKFLKNCNYAAKQARGKYLVFLNNDTQVQKNWLLPLVELMNKDDNIGALGSKLVFENGLLQEAGAIMWDDATAWNYGRMKDPALPEFNYVKEVDYVSGAAMMIRKAVWDKIGGFSEIFAPAYCEDSDLCFSIREMGFKVLYQPESVVVHFEGVSNGTSISEGQKQYQVVNKKKFYDKWKNTLICEHFRNGDNVFHARDRSRNRKTLLMIDHYVPHFDRDAGSVTDFQYLNLFINLGFNVKFIGDNFFKHEPYTTILEQMGIEVLYGIFYAKKWKTWLKENGKYIDYVYLNRPHISIKYINEVKMYTNAKIIYYGHDLHFLRELREYDIKKERKLLKFSIKWKKIEFELMSKADISYYPSQTEVDEIKKENKTVNVKIIPAFLYEKKPKEKRNFKNTNDIMFIGGFDHRPNVDGVLWYANEINPLIIKIRPEIKTYIIGSNAPKEILELNSGNTIITGYITGERLIDYYRNCRLSIVPLRFGAGIKGKIIEAMYYQMPVVTTSVGAEGIKDAENYLFIKDDPSAFAEEIIRVYDDLNLLSEISLKEINVVNETFSTTAAKRILMDDLAS